MKDNDLSIWRALFGWIDQPKKTLRYVIKESRWSLLLAPALAVFVALAIYTLVSAPAASELAREQATEQMAAQMGSLTDEQAEQVEASVATFTSPLFIAATGIVLGVLGLIVTWLFRGALVFFISYLFGTDNKFKQMVTLCCGLGGRSPCETWCRPSMCCSTGNSWSTGGSHSWWQAGIRCRMRATSSTAFCRKWTYSWRGTCCWWLWVWP